MTDTICEDTNTFLKLGNRIHEVLGKRMIVNKAKSAKKIELNDLRKIICLRKSEVKV